MRKKKRSKSPCYIYKSCEHVPCGATMNSCFPSYCVKGSSRNWGVCNMVNWGKGYEMYKPRCRDESKCVMKNTPITKNTVDARVLHNKMPYIWRFLKPQTRKHMIELANKKVEEINVPYMLFPDIPKKTSTSASKFIKNMTRRLPKRVQKQFYTRRKKYRNI